VGCFPVDWELWRTVGYAVSQNGQEELTMSWFSAKSALVLAGDNLPNGKGT
jgi:hypothetical protein